MKEREKKRITSLIIMFCMLLTMISGITTRVQAAVIYNVSDYSSLTAAIANAVDGDTINITNDITITAEIAITKALIIEGNSHIITVPVPGLSDSGIYNSNPSPYRVFDINAPGKTVEINNLTIKGGCINGTGAGILTTNTVLKLNNINVSNSRADGSRQYGGGIVNNGGTVYLKDSNISRNAADFGGGFLNLAGSTMFIENCTISENRSTDIAGGGGGGQNNGTLYVNNSTFSNNKSTELGGAINNRPSSTAYIVNSTFTGNVAYGSFDGGAIANNSGEVIALNSLFAYNYHNNGTNYVLNDVSGSYNPVDAYYCIFHASNPNITDHIGNSQYNGNADGSDNSIFTNGVNALVLDGDGQTIGTNTIFQPLLEKVNGSITPTALLKTGSFALSKGVITGFTNGDGSPTIGYYNGTNWVDLTGSNSENYQVSTDQNNESRTATPTVGAVETTSSMIYMLKVNASNGGTVNGGTIYGDAYAAGTNVTLTAIPDDGYTFTEWDYVDGGTASTSNPYTLSVTQNTTLVPVFSVTSTKSVTYVDNGSTGGTVPTSISTSSGSLVTVSDNTGNLVKSGYAFAGWNTAANGSGTQYAAGDTFNLAGNVALYAQWTSATVPDTPTNVNATAGNASASVTWTAPANDGGSPLTDYIVNYTDGVTPNTFDTQSTTPSATITGLTNGTQYTFTVNAVNGVGDSTTSSATTVTPAAPITTYTATINLKKDGSTWTSSGKSITLQQASETPTPTIETSGVFTASVVNGTWKVLVDGVDTGRAVVINNGAASQDLNYYTVQFAVANTGTASGSTISATYNSSAINTGDVVLGGNQLIITAVGQGASSYTYAWGGAGTNSETTAALTIPSLSSSANATCYVAGIGAPPVITTTSLPEGTVNTAYNQSLSALTVAPLSWRIVNGFLPQGLTINPNTGAITGTPTTAGTSTFKVQVLNSYGSDAKTYSVTIAASSATVIVPSAPTGVNAKAGNASASITWTTPANDGGSPITDYLVNIYSNGNSIKTVNTGSTTPSATVIDLTNGTPYTFTVNAENSVGYSTTSSATSVVVPTAPAGAPDAPQNVTVTAGDSYASLTWTAPANDGGSPITDYLIDVYPNGSLVKTIDTGSTATSATVTGLVNGTAYTFDVKAVNNVGAGAPTSATNVVTPTAPHESRDSYGSGTGATSTPTSAGPTITANVVDEGSGSNSETSVNATVKANSDGTDTVSVKPSDAIIMKQPDGTTAPFEDYSKIGYNAPSNAPVTINSDGTLEVSNLTKGSSYDIPVTYDMGNGQKITIGNMHISVDASGNVKMTSNLIDPYGTLTDSLSGKAISGANVTLYYADTARNRSAGKTPGTIVQLPIINGFKPNNNQDPQTTDSNGTYGFMVYPNTDYYIVVTKDGYDTYTSPTIPVETGMVKFSVKLNPPVTGIKRIAGNTRVDTAIELAKSEFTGKVNSIIFATADNYPDALTGSVLAYNQSAPILLVGDSQDDQNKVLTYMKDYLVNNGKVFLLGGTGVVTDNFADQVKSAGCSNVIRLGGADRYETATKIADYLNIAEGTPVVIASGENYPDALSVSSAAAVNQYPILLVTNNTISDLVKSELTKIKPSKVYIIGGQGAISESVENQLAQMTSLSSDSIVRLGGTDRYSTSIIVANNFKLPGKSACIATGTNFPDALAGSIYAANYNAPIILVGSALTDEEKTYIQNSKLSGATIFGGEGAVNDEIQNEVTGVLSK